jgi:hypothetical protein
MVRMQTVYLHYMIVQRCLAQMERTPNECPGPGTGVNGTCLLEASGRLDMAVFQGYFPCVTQHALCIMYHLRFTAV